jgi:predicted AlkP superfamily pyrophosphatase or phosphodiesterase
VVMMGGRAIDAGYWWKGTGFASFKGVALSPAALAQNVAVAAAVKKGAPSLAVPAWCGARGRAVAIGKGSVGTGRFSAPAGNLAAWRGSPRIDLATVDLALALVAEQGLGADAVPDVLSVSLSATDFIGHGYGTGGMEMCLQMATLDRALGRLFAGLDARGIDYAVVLSADHGGLDTIERLDHQALPRADRSADDLSVGAFEQEIRKRTGITLAEPLLYADGINGDYYVSHALTPAQRTRVADALLTVARGHRQVAAAFSQAELARTPLPSGNPQDWSLKDRARASFDAERSGDVVVLLDRAIAPIPVPAIGTYIATHGSAWDYDRRVPILFWRRGLAGFEQPAPVETIDIAPTLAAILGLKLPDGAFDGRCLDIDGGAGNSCEGVR